MKHLSSTLDVREDVEVLTAFGHYAAVLKLSDELALAISTDGVGSKTLIASALDRYDTIGFDCVAMNANDVICVGARPIAMVDYIGVHELADKRTDEILKGLGAAAKEAGIAIPGGELSQLPDIIGSSGALAADDKIFDLVGTCVGTMHPEALVLGHAIEPGDAIIGLHSSGIHSNGLTLARRVLLSTAGYRLDDDIPVLGRTLGEELLRPTEIYVRAVAALWKADIPARGLAHVTGDGLANLCRLEADVGYVIGDLPDPPPIFNLIQEAGGIEDAEMFRVFNMGVGFVVIVPPGDATAAVNLLTTSGYRAARIGTVTPGERRVVIERAGLEGGLASGESWFRRL